MKPHNLGSAAVLFATALLSATSVDAAEQRTWNYGKRYGEIPMVGYGGGAFIMTVLDRAGIGEPDDCGDGQGSKLEALTCKDVSTNPGGGPGDPNNPGGPGADTDGDGVPDANEIPFVNACLCKTGPQGGLSPAGIAFVLGLPVIVFARRRRSRR